MEPHDEPPALESISRVSRAEYVARVNRVIDHIEANLNRPLPLDELAAVACFSPHHFHRIFGAMVGETLGQFIQRLRVERAARLLLRRPEEKVSHVALDSGFASASTLARAFKAAFGMSASQFRTQSDAASLMNRKLGKHLRKLGEAPAGFRRYIDPHNPRRTYWSYEMAENRCLADAHVEVCDLPEYHLAYLRLVGPYGQPAAVRALMERLSKWADARGLLNEDSRWLLVPHDSPQITEASKLRLSVCVTVPEGTRAEGDVGTMQLPAGKTAVGRFEIPPDQVPHAWRALIGEWLPDSGYQPDDRLCHETLVTSPPNHPEGKIVLEIGVPVRPL